MKTKLLRKPLLVLTLLAGMIQLVSAASFESKVVGEGEPLIFIPGLTCPGEVWDETVEKYSENYECHVLSLAGFAGTPAVELDGKYLQTVKDELILYIRDHQLKNTVVVGHSLGGFLAMWLASEVGDEISGLVLVDSLPFMSAIMNPAATEESAKPMAEQVRQGLLNAPGGEAAENYVRQMLSSLMSDEEKIEIALNWNLASDTPTVAQAMYEMQTTDLRQEIANVKVPTLIMGSWIAYQNYGSTMESTAAIFNRQYQAIPDFELVMSEAGKHFIMWDDFEMFMEKTDSFLAGLSK